MPAEAPPERFDSPPRAMLLPAGTVLWRVHHRRFDSCQFTDRPADGHFGGGRFDATADQPYPFLYAAPKESTAVAERLLRGRQFGGYRRRVIERASIAGRRLSALETTRELRLITLVSATDLATVYQDDWLVQADEAEYGRTRRWGHRLRREDPAAAGLVWQSRRDRPHLSMVLFADRLPPGAPVLEPAGFAPVDLDEPAGISWLNTVLKPYRACIAPMPFPAAATAAAS
jgi:hypothetical protein